MPLFGIQVLALAAVAIEWSADTGVALRDALLILDLRLEPLAASSHELAPVVPPQPCLEPQAASSHELAPVAGLKPTRVA